MSLIHKYVVFKKLSKHIRRANKLYLHFNIVPNRIFSDRVALMLLNSFMTFGTRNALIWNETGNPCNLYAVADS